MPGIWYQVGLTPRRPFRPRRLAARACRASTWARTTTSAGPSPTSWPTSQDLFVERVEGDRYLFEDEWRPLEVVREEIVGQGARRARACSRCASPTTGRSSTRRSAPTTPSRWRCAGITLDEPTAFEGMFELHEIGSGPELVAKLEGHSSPASNLIWADRHGSIGYKLIGRLPLRKGGCPDLPKPGWTRRVRVGGDDPLRGAAGDGRPRERLPGHRQQPHRRRRVPAPHHQRVARRLPRPADRAAAARERRARRRGLRGDAVRQPLDPRARGGAAAGPARTRRASASAARSSGCAAGTGGSTPTRSPARSTRPSCCAWRARSPAPRSATATSASAGSTAPTTASPRTSPRPGAGTRT